jgi:hypothetical protein
MQQFTILLPVLQCFTCCRAGSGTFSGVQIARASASIKLFLEQMAEKILRLRRAEKFLLFSARA